MLSTKMHEVIANDALCCLLIKPPLDSLTPSTLTVNLSRCGRHRRRTENFGRSSSNGIFQSPDSHYPIVHGLQWADLSLTGTARVHE